MKVLFAVWELSPFFQVGGLGDVARSLPVALYELGIDIRVILPHYKALKLQGQRRKLVKNIQVDYGGKKVDVAIYLIYFKESKIPVYLLFSDDYLSIPSKETFAFFNLTLIEILKKNFLDWQPKIIHCNDHHTGLIPLLIKHNGLNYRTIFTVHNLLHKGESDIETVHKIGLDESKCRVLEWEIKRKRVNFLLEGLVHCDHINAVSPTYSREILTEEYGVGLDEILRDMQYKISGILNGIDYNKHNPATDKNIIYHFNHNDKTKPADGKKKIYSFTEGKKLNKKFCKGKGFFLQPLLEGSPTPGYLY